jgi:hydroxypyruvate reductase
MTQLEPIYLETLARCAPERLVRKTLRPALPRNVVAVGKCAGALLDGVAAAHQIDHAFAAIPDGYRLPTVPADLAIGGHPDYTAASFEAGRRLIEFVDSHADILFLISGGGSACVELPLNPPFTAVDLAEVNAKLLASGIPIGEINIVRKHLSAIKGGRLAARVRGRSVTLVYSDVSSGNLQDVASGPTIADRSTNLEAAAILERVGGCDRVVAALRQEKRAAGVAGASSPEIILVADNGTLTSTAASIIHEHALVPVEWRGQIEDDVETAAAALAARAANLRRGEVLVAGGEPTVVRQGSGKGGRCSELAVRFVLRAAAGGPRDVAALFGSSDGLDGSSGVAGVAIDRVPAQLDRASIERDLGESNSIAAAMRLGRTIMIPPAGNNLRDLFLLARS